MMNNNNSNSPTSVSSPSSSEDIPSSIFAFIIGTSKQIDFLPLFPKNITEATANTLRGITSARNVFVSSLMSIQTEDALDTALQNTMNYIPGLFSLINAVQNIPPETSINGLKISWSSCIGISQSKPFQSNQWHFEVINTLLVLGMLHRAKAMLLLQRATCNDIQGDGSTAIVRHLCTASGIFNYLREVELSRWTLKPSDSLPEKYAEVYIILAQLSLAEAQIIALRKAILKNSSKPTIAKLAIDVYNKFNYIREIMITISQEKLLPNTLVFYIKFNIVCHFVLAMKALGITCIEKMEYGKGIGYLNAALEKGKPEIDMIKKKMTQTSPLFFRHYSEVISLLRTNVTLNDTVYFEKVASFGELEIPEGYCFLKPVVFEPVSSEAFSIEINDASRCYIC